VILDEIDAIMRQRRNSDDGSGAIAIYDGMTTQLLALLDGLHSVGNVLVFGLTNRRDALDPALLRPGRLEVELRLPLPTEQGRAEILGIHTERMRARGLIAADVSLASIAAETASFSGADIAGLVRAAFSYAVTRGLYASMDAADGSGDHFEALTMADFARALPEVRRAKAWAGESAQLALRRGLIALPSFGAALHAATALIAHDLEKMPPWSRVRVLLHGPPESGVTAAAASLCANAPTAFDATYVLRADTLIGMGRDAVVDAIRMMGDAAQEVDRSCIVLDGLDVLLDAFNGFASVSSAVRSLLRAGVAPLARPSSDDGAAAETVGARVAVIATANNLAAISPLGPAASLFDVESATPLLGISETRQVLEAYGGIAAPEAERIAEQLAADIPLKRLVRAIDLARGRLATVRSRSAEGTTYAAAAAEPLGCRAAGYEGNAGGANALDLPECTPMGAGVAAATLSRVVLNAAASLHIDVPIDRSRW
jgi:vesicle-fusing ATPase